MRNPYDESLVIGLVWSRARPGGVRRVSSGKEQCWVLEGSWPPAIEAGQAHPQSPMSDKRTRMVEEFVLPYLNYLKLSAVMIKW